MAQDKGSYYHLGNPIQDRGIHHPTSSDECLEQAEAWKSMVGTAMQDLVTKEESCMPPTSTEASEEDHDISRVNDLRLF